MRDTTLPSGDSDWLLQRLPENIRRGLAPELRAALMDAAAGARPWSTHPVDIRFSVPLIFRRFYLAVVAGPERRSPARRAADRETRVLMRMGNAMFVLCSVVIFYGLLMLAAAVLTRLSA